MKFWKVTGKTGKISWQIFHRTPEGKGVGKRFRTKKEADDYLAKVAVAKRENRYHDVFEVKKETRTTFNQLADRYAENFKNQKCFRSKDQAIRVLRAEFGDKRLGQLTYMEIETWRNRRKATPTNRPERVRADGSVNFDLAVLRHMLNKAVQWGFLETSPFQKGEQLSYKLNNARTRFLTEIEIEALLGECPTHLKPIVETAILSGMRLEELLSLKWEQIRNKQIYLTETKYSKPRQIPINGRLAEVFREVRHGNQLKSPYVFCNSRGRRYKEIRKPFHGACRRAGIEDFKFHDLRHTFASHLIMQGAGLAAVGKLLGHADIKMTMRYSHLSQAHLQETVFLLDNLTGAKKSLNFLGEDKKVIANPL
jgi:integrase